MGEIETIGIEAPTAVVVFDKPRTLRLNVAAQIHAKRGIRDLRRMAGADPGEVSDWEVFAGGVESSVALVWGCLLHEDRDLKIATVAEWLHPGSLPKVGAVLNRMIAAYLPPQEEAGPLAEGEAPAQ